MEITEINIFPLFHDFPSILIGVALRGARKAEMNGPIKPVAIDITAKLLHVFAHIFLCSLCTKFDILLSRILVRQEACLRCIKLPILSAYLLTRRVS